jgi:hypothetical protein
MMLVLRSSLIGALIGAFVAGSLMFVGFFILNHHDMVTHDGDEVQAWTWFAAWMGTGGAAIVGSILGATCGAVRAYKELRKEPPRTPSSVWGSD